MGQEEAGNQNYQQNHMALLFKEGFSFSGFERDGLYLNVKGTRFLDISGISGIDSISDGRSAVLVDLDNDGDLDVFLTTIQGEGHLLFRNNVGQDGHFIRVSLEGSISGRDAFGAVVRLKTDQGIQTRIHSGGSGFLAQHDARLLFGLGQSEKAEWMEIIWPSGEIQRFGPIRSGLSVKVLEGEDRFETIKDQTVSLPDPLDEDQIFWSKLKFRKGDPFPELKLHSLLDGEETLFSSKPDGAYLLNFWATWCGPCR